MLLVLVCFSGMGVAFLLCFVYNFFFGSLWCFQNQKLADDIGSWACNVLFAEFIVQVVEVFFSLNFYFLNMFVCVFAHKARLLLDFSLLII